MKNTCLLGTVLLLFSLTAIGQQANRVSALKDTLCEGTIGYLTLNNNSDSTIQWQSSTNDTNFTNIKGADGIFYKTVPVLATTWFRAVVGSDSNTTYSDTLRLFVPPPVTVTFSYSYSYNGRNSYTFNSTASTGNIARYFWDFGDGDASNVANPVHAYKMDSTYLVCLSVYDAFCSYTYCRTADFLDYPGGGWGDNPWWGVPTLLANDSWAIYPNPFSNQLTVTAKQQNSPMQTIEMYNLLGQQVFFNNTENLHTINYPLPMPSLSCGMYYLVIKTATANYVQKVLRQ